MKPLAIDLFSGVGGWTDGLMAEGYDPVGFDIKRHVYGEHRYPGQLVLQDVLTLHGSQFRDAALIVASPPCQKYSYMAMPWTRAKDLARWYRDPEHPERIVELNALFNACFRIQREASEAAGRHIPMVVENVRGAQPWVGRARWNFGSFYLWGDVPALMPVIKAFKSSGMNWSDQTIKGQDFTRIAGNQAIKNHGGSWFSIGSPGQKVTNQNPVNGVKNGHDWFGSGEDCSAQRRHGSKSIGRKAASAMIAKIPLPLARHIARVYRPDSEPETLGWF